MFLCIRICVFFSVCFGMKRPERERVTENLLAVLATIPRVMAPTNCVHYAAKSACAAVELVFNYENG